MNAEAKTGPTIGGVSVHALPARAVAQQFFRDGEGLASNPYERGTNEHENFMLEMHRLQLLELDGLRAEMNARI